MAECAQQSKNCSVHEPCCTKAPLVVVHYTIALQIHMAGPSSASAIQNTLRTNFGTM